MELNEYHCPNCTATLTVDPEKDEAVCEYCGSVFEINSREREAEQEGYAFEMGRMKARREMNTVNSGEPETVFIPKKNNLWLWIIGWILFFPIPLTVLIVRSQKINTPVKIALLVLLWGFVLYAGLTGDTDTQSAAVIQSCLTV